MHQQTCQLHFILVLYPSTHVSSSRYIASMYINKLLITPFLSSLEEKPGTCPEVPADMFGICGELCTDDDSCEGSQKCCSNNCGHVCQEPVPGKCILQVQILSAMRLIYSKTPLLKPPLSLRKNGLYSGVVLLLN